MRVIDQDTGKPFHLDVTEQLHTDLDAHNQSACDHSQTEIRRRKSRGGAWHFYRQCVACGASVGSAIKKSSEFENSPDWKEGHEDQYVATRRAQ